MNICFVCKQQVFNYEDFEWFGLDGDRIHKKCKKNLNKVYEHINNLTDEEFTNYIYGY